MSLPERPDDVGISVDGEPIEFVSADLMITNDLDDVYNAIQVDGLGRTRPLATKPMTFSASLTLDRESYIAYLKRDFMASLYTVTVRHGGPPPDPFDQDIRLVDWGSLKALLRQMRDIVVWGFKRAAGMHPPVVEITVPNCRLGIAG